MASQIKVFATYITASHWYPECAHCNNKATPYETDNEYEVTTPLPQEKRNWPRDFIRPSVLLVIRKCTVKQQEYIAFGSSVKILKTYCLWLVRV